MLNYFAIETTSYSPYKKIRKHFIGKVKHILKAFLSLLENKLNYNADFEIETEKDKL